jgi:hypothetical protein
VPGSNTITLALADELGEIQGNIADVAADFDDSVLRAHSRAKSAIDSDSRRFPYYQYPLCLNECSLILLDV